MQNCNICQAKLGNAVNDLYQSSEKTLLLLTPCCNKLMCIRCMLKCDKIECPFCDDALLNMLPQSIARLTKYKIHPTQNIDTKSSERM
jgi:hypothetical protein